MIKFVIIEDDSNYKNICKKIIDKIMFSNNVAYEFNYFDRYSKDLQAIINDNSIFKIFIMDIELKGTKSGLDIAKQIREDDWDSEIIFITSHDKMFEPVFRTIFKVFDFIEKFHNLESRLEQDLKTIISKDYDTKKFFYVNKRSELQIYLKDILYIYRDTTERKIVLVTTKNKFFANLSISETLLKLDERFKQIHRACIVNTNKVSCYNWNEGYFVLCNGKKIDLCSKNYKEDSSVKR